MKIVLVDNYDRPGFIPKVVAKGLEESFAERVVGLLNEEEDDMSPNYYVVRPESYVVETDYFY